MHLVDGVVGGAVAVVAPVVAALHAVLGVEDPQQALTAREGGFEHKVGAL